MIVRFALQRIVMMVPVLFIVSVVVFLMVHLTPGDLVASLAGTVVDVSISDPG